MKNGFLYALITAIVFATFESVAKLVATDFSPIAMCIMRFLIGGLLFLPFLEHVLCFLSAILLGVLKR